VSVAAVTFEELLADFDLTAARWKEFFAANPGAAAVPTDIARSGTIGGLVWHIYAAAVRLSERLLGEPTSDFASVTVKDIAGAWEMHARATAKLRSFLAAADDAVLDEVLRFEIRTMGELAATRRKVCLHAFVHAMRHWAQIGPLVRQNGFPVEWPQDILFSSAIR
jgi:uncharacterized damage-inducible protein DinB